MPKSAASPLRLLHHLCKSKIQDSLSKSNVDSQKQHLRIRSFRSTPTRMRKTLTHNDAWNATGVLSNNHNRPAKSTPHPVCSPLGLAHNSLSRCFSLQTSLTNFSQPTSRTVHAAARALAKSHPHIVYIFVAQFPKPNPSNKGPSRSEPTRVSYNHHACCMHIFAKVCSSLNIFLLPASTQSCSFQLVHTVTCCHSACMRHAKKSPSHACMLH